MTTFHLITNKVINLENNIFSFNYKPDNINAIHKIFFYQLIDNLKTAYDNKRPANKFYFFQKTISNFYFSKNVLHSKEYIYLFNKIQRVYHVLNRFSFLYKCKKSKLAVNTDLQLNTIQDGDKNVICIYHMNARYLFKIEELLKIIFTSLTNSYLFFSEPIPIKNPYNNLPFGKSVLYYIYFYLITKVNIGYIKCEHIELFLKFKSMNFDITEFLNNYEHILRDYSIKNYILNSTKEQLEKDILKMIQKYNSSIDNINRHISIDSEFPTTELIKIMKPYLYLYLTGVYSLVNKSKIESQILLRKKLNEFNRFNPKFGRRITYFTNKIINGKLVRVRDHYEFFTVHKKFLNYDNDLFMKNHLTYKNTLYDAEDSDDEESSISTVVIEQTNNVQYVYVEATYNENSNNADSNNYDVNTSDNTDTTNTDTNDDITDDNILEDDSDFLSDNSDNLSDNESVGSIS